MEGSHYEQHHYEDPKFPVLFHLDTLSESMVFVPHWHQNLEILYFLEGGRRPSPLTQRRLRPARGM